MIRLTCIRHTSVAVPSGIVYGQTDVAVAASYPEELKQLAEKLKGVPVDQVFSSPLGRCSRLATDLFPCRPVNFDERLKELNFGRWEGKSWDEIYRSDAGKFWMDHYLTASCPEGESYPELRERVISFLKMVTALKAGHIVLVTHGGVIRLVKSLLDDQPMEEIFATFNPDYGGIYTFQV